MSSNFDPTKLDLDPNNLKSTDHNNIPLTNESPSESTDILWDLDTKQVPTENKDISNDPLANDIKIDAQDNTEVSSDTGTILDEIDNTETPLEEDSSLKEENTKIVDINIASLENIVDLIRDKKYDYVLVEPEDSLVKVTFKQDNIDRDVRYIKYPVYTNILFKVKQVTGLVMEDTGSQQEWKWPLKLGAKIFKVSSKTAPGQNGERIFIAAKVDNSQAAKKKAQKTSLSMILGFLGAILFVSLILGGAFIAFIVLNANDVNDVKFFASLGINLNDINTFISQVVMIIFSILLFITTTVLSIFLFKFFLTKKAYKRKKIVYGVLSGFMLIVTFATWSAWMYIDREIKSLPNWQEQAYGDLKIFNNDLLVSDSFSTEQALIQNTQNLIWPITLQFDLENFQNNQARVGVTIEKYIWDFWWDTVESFTPKINRLFEEKWNYEISVTAIGTDNGWEVVEQSIGNIPSISLSHLIEYDERTTRDGWKKPLFDANDLSDLWDIIWYIKELDDDTWEEVDAWYEYSVWKVYFEEFFVGIAIDNGSWEDVSISKVLIISPDWEADISWNIVANQDIVNDLMYTFQVENARAGVGDGFIESYEWKIEDKTYTVSTNFSDPTRSPEVEHEFDNFWEQEIEVILTDTKWQIDTLIKTINIQKRVSLRSQLDINLPWNQEIENLRYEESTFEYYIDDFGIPEEIILDASLVRPENILYALKDVNWDVKNDGNIDATGKKFTYLVPTEWNHVISANYIFEHRKIPGDTISLTEFIYISWVKKEAILNLKMEFDSIYAPVTVRFDASESFIKNDNIVKFVYDYGDGISEERDAINPGHRYTEAWDYNVTLTVVGESGKRYSTEKQLILLPPAQTVKVSASIKKAPVWQGIDFSSADSSGQIVEYFWDFWDGNISTSANPTHNYSKSWNYTVKLEASYANKNIDTDTIEVEIYE